MPRGCIQRRCPRAFLRRMCWGDGVKHFHFFFLKHFLVFPSQDVRSNRVTTKYHQFCVCIKDFCFWSKKKLKKKKKNEHGNIFIILLVCLCVPMFFCWICCTTFLLVSSRSEHPKNEMSKRLGERRNKNQKQSEKTTQISVIMMDLQGAADRHFSGHCSCAMTG